MEILVLIIQPTSKETIERNLQKHVSKDADIEFYFCIGLQQAWSDRHKIKAEPFENVYVGIPQITSGGRTSFTRLAALMYKPFRSKAYLVDETGQISRCSWAKLLFYDLPNLIFGVTIGLITIFISMIFVWSFRQYLRWSS